MRWIKNHKFISFIIALAILSAVLITAGAARGGNGPVSGALGNIYYAVEKPVAKVTGAISERIYGIFQYKDIIAENKELRKENSALKQQIIGLTMSSDDLKELKKLKKVLNYNKGKDHEIVTADVVSMDGSRWMNIFTINAGTESGIKEGNTVVFGDCIVGRVNSCGKGWARVISIIDDNNKISFEVADKTKQSGIAYGDKEGNIEGFTLDSNAMVTQGDDAVTTGMGVYPAGLRIGKITKVRYDSNEQLQKVDIKPFVDFLSLKKVSVIL